MSIDQYIASPSASKRGEALQLFSQMSPDDKRNNWIPFFSSPYRDLREGLLELLPQDELEADPAWLASISEQTSISVEDNPLVAIGMLALLARFSQKLDRHFIEFAESCLRSTIADLQYQALVFLELQCDDSDFYVKTIESLYDSNDSDMRMIAYQATERLAPAWGLEKLANAAKRARGAEGFQVLLSRLHLGDGDLRKNLEHLLILKLFDDRFCYPAIDALKKYGSEACVDSLLKIAGSFFGEPTIKVAAAEAAAVHGSSKAVELLRKFASKKRGNPEYARQALQQLGLS